MTELQDHVYENQTPESGIRHIRTRMLDGMTINYVAVPDISNNDEHQASKEQVKTETGLINDLLRLNPQIEGPHSDKEKTVLHTAHNEVADWMYETKPGLKIWRTKLVPTAIALTALYEAESWTLPTGDEVDAATRDYFIHSLDAVGIRTRATIMSDIAKRYVERDGSTTEWTSIACGAAIPVLDALRDSNIGSGAANLKLIDIDDNALAHAEEKATARGLEEGVDFRTMNRNVVKDLILSDNLVQELGPESQKMVDMLGIFEYIDEYYGDIKFPSAATFLANSYKLVKPGGVLVAANMLKSHPQIDFNQRAIGWPKIFPREEKEILRIITEAGIAPEQVTMTIPEDGIYAVFEIRKPLETDTSAAA